MGRNIFFLWVYVLTYVGFENKIYHST